MTEIIQGNEDPAETAARRAKWLASASERLPANSATTLADLIRALESEDPTFRARLDTAKQNRP